MPLARLTLAIAIAAPTWAGAGTPSAALDAEGAGFSAAWLGRITTWYRAQIDAGALPGAVVAIARNGRLAYLQAIGSRDRARTVPLQFDAIFRIASMTKPVTSVAAMMLVEDRKLDLTAPVDAYLPELKGMRVGVERKNPATGEAEVMLEEAKRPMTVRDLLRHTAGLTYPEEDSTAMHRLYRRAAFTPDATLAEFVASLAKLPLVHQPGEVWEYSWGDDVLARVVEVASGQCSIASWRTACSSPRGWSTPAFTCPRTSSHGSSIRLRSVGPRRGMSARDRGRSREVADRCRRRPTICGSARCCSTAANATASGYCDGTAWRR
jgi:CubicO group peptidase (beta-lactamase class C family)